MATTNRANFVVGVLAESGNPYDGHALARSIEQVQRIIGGAVERSFVERGYRGARRISSAHLWPETKDYAADEKIT